MKNSRLIQLLSSLKYKELKRFEQFAASPYFNSKQRTLDLLRILKSNHPAFDKVEKERVFKKLFPKEQFSDQKIRRAMSDLYKLLQDFLVYESVASEPQYQSLLFLQALNSRNLDKLFLQQFDQVKKELDDQPFRDVHFHYLSMRTEEAVYTYLTSRENKRQGTNLKDLVNQIDYHFLYRKLKYSCEILNRQHVVSGQYEKIPLLEPILNHLKKFPVDEVPGVKIYLQTLFMLQEPDDEGRYWKLKALLLEHIDQFPANELKDMFLFAQNYCIRRANKGDKRFIEELFEVYRVLVDKEVIGAATAFTKFDFDNITRVALLLDQFDWLENFTDQFVDLLPNDTRSNAMNLNMANIAFARGEFRNALRSLMQVDSKDIYTQLAQKVLLLKIYYELNDVEPFMSLVESFRKFLSRNTTISEYHYTIRYNLIKFAKYLFECKTEGKRSPAEIQEDMQQVREIAELTWLEKKVEELEAAK